VTTWNPRANEFFLKTLELRSADERRTYLDAVCAGDAGLRAEVEALLEASANAGDFLESPVPRLNLIATVDEPSITESPGMSIGPYKLLEQIGEGGFGVVFMAEQQQPIRRKVALKVVKPGMDTRQVVGRFEAERQALALMDHPNIAHVFDGGQTSTGRPYFVMELVRGIPITDFCDQNRLPVRQRLELFITVCQAIQHAHLKSIIHRDIKPTNVLVTLHDDKAVVKVIDFGIAKATGQRLTDKTLFTNFAQMIGTPTYMSPEQAQMNGLDIDTRTDIYALGVLLYELLTGTTPFDRERLKTAGFDEVRRIIREEEPPKPSTRISTLGQAAETVSVRRAADAKQLSRLFRGELDWIVMKALEKDRNRRYESGSALAADVERYLKDEPVLACPPSLSYRLRKLVRRHRGSALAASLVILMLVGGIIGTTRGMIRATDAEAAAMTEANQKKTALKDKEAALADAQEKLFQALVQQARAERSSDRVGQRFEALAAIRRAARMRVTSELRTEAIAALVQPDVEIVHEWRAWPEGSLNLAFDASYHRYVRMDRQGGIVVCQLRDGQEAVVTRLPTQAKPPFGGVAMSPDGRCVAYVERLGGGSAANVALWKVEGPTPELLLEVPEGLSEAAMAFRSNGRQLAIGHADSSVSVYDLATAKRVQRLSVGSRPFHLAFHPRDSRLAVACGNEVRLFDAGTGRELSVLRHMGAASDVYSVAWHPDGRRLAAGCYDHSIRLWDTETTTELVLPWKGFAVFFNHAGDLLASRDWSGTTQVWDVASARLLLTIPSHGGAFSADDQIFGHTENGNNIRLWRLAGGRELRALRSDSDNPDSVGHPVVDDRSRVVAASGGHWLSFYDIGSGEQLASVRLPRLDDASPVFFDPPHPPGSAKEKPKRGEVGGWMTGGHSALYLWPARLDSVRPGVLRVGPPQLLAPDSGAGFSVGTSASTNGQVVAVPQGKSTLVLQRDQPSRRLVLGPQYDVRSSAVSPDCRWVVTCSHWWDGRSKSALIWDVKTGQRVHEMPLGGSTSAKFSPDGNWLMTNSASGSQLWEVGTWREVRRFKTASFAFSPDSRLLAIGDVLSVIRLLETTTGREVARLTGPDSVWYRPDCFTSDGTRLITSGFSNTLYVWDLPLIRHELKELGLDWDWPEFPPPDSSGQNAKTLKVEVELGDLGKPSLTREQRSRQAIERYRSRVAAKPDDARACNNLAWVYVTAPEPLRDVNAALPLAEKAVQLEPKNALYRNTLGVAYYRAGRYREAVEILRVNLASQENWGLAFDLYFLAMSHQRRGDAARARDYYDWAVRWTRTQQELSADQLNELAELRAEANKLLGIEEK
jgi:serine/threonine protein kinase/WD40 repeat protein